MRPEAAADSGDHFHSDLPLISVIVPCCNEVETISATLQAIVDNHWPELEIIVIDGNSQDGTQAIVLDFISRQAHSQLRIRLIDNPARSTPIALNLGIQAAQGEYIQRVDARQILDPNYLTVCYQKLQANPKLACVGGQAIHEYRSQTGQQIALAMMSPFGVGLGNWRTLQKEQEVDSITAPLYRRAIFEQVGHFDQALVRNQDDEFHFRLSQAGYRILYTPETALHYSVRSRYRDLYKQYFQYGYWKVYVNCKHHQITSLRQLVPAAFVAFVSLGAVLIGFWKAFRWLYAAILLLYTLLGLISARQAKNKAHQLKQHFSGTAPAGAAHSAPIFAAFVLMHSAYGSGYLKGIWQFVLKRQAPEARHTQLSR